MFSKLLIYTLYDKNMTLCKLAKNIGTSLQNLSNKKIRDNFSEKEMLEIAKALNMDLEIKLVPRIEGKK